jgi:NAD(P)-dependent dehydrogenase (short-subunit alcohol dehydrogenase family)
MQTTEVLSRYDLADKVVLVTGASRGIGRAIALACAKAGAHLALGVRNPDASAPLVAELAASGKQPLPLRLDITDARDVAFAVGAAQDKFGRIDVLVNNVGVGPENRAENVTEAEFDYTLIVNL